MCLRSVHLVDDLKRVRGDGRRVTDLMLTGIFQNHLLLRPFQDVLFHCVLADEPEDADMRLLSNSMCSCHCLQVVLWVPIALRVY